MEEIKQEKQVEVTKHSKTESPFAFISHDTRDADIAEAFSKLLKSVSAGMLKSFRSSDNKGTQGIEFGIEWYPKIIESLQDSSDVVCLLTELSINRPWILFEAGMAKGKLNTPILGVAVGIPLSNASTGPFAQFQNCDDEVASLSKLVKQLVRKLPNSEPDEDVIKQQVEIFKVKSQEIIKARQEKSEVKEVEKPVDNNESAKLFEEVKLMFKELPSRIENASQKTSNKSNKRLHPGMIEELIHYSFSRNIEPRVILQIILAPFKNDFPWIYESGVVLVEKVGKVKHIQSTKAFKEFMELIDFTFDNPIYRENYRDEYEYRYFREIPYLIERFFKELEYKKAEMDDENK
ncbi:toll/interleukin-1 receptor domain-containing protein [Limnovirga soli]|uniref:TIR domain-containing protein n=1 Tax=Limnovirga soli TaxID=2656915 RepID=A0A8J8FBG8_9BACT|nr:toll/interleukin-1 receptor domain-containing protein [Limnovirga soli]NNV54941.1 TIR domain-containing protein [Limnovirga soli]